jgi:hypothetical protein
MSAGKLKHTNKDRDAFLEVMNAEPPVNHGELKHASTRVGALIGSSWPRSLTGFVRKVTRSQPDGRVLSDLFR